MIGIFVAEQETGGSTDVVHGCASSFYTFVFICPFARSPQNEFLQPLSGVSNRVPPNLFAVTPRHNRKTPTSVLVCLRKYRV